MTNRAGENTLLIVNDTPDQLELMGMILRQAGYQVVAAVDGRAGLELARRERPDLVISDVMMPGVDGVKLCRLIRADSDLSVTPILLVSGIRKDAASAVEGLNAGADDYLEAPYDPMRLIAQVARLLERKHYVDALRLSEERFRLLIEGVVNYAIVMLDVEGRVVNWNAGAERIIGYREEEIIGRHYSCFHAREDISAGKPEQALKVAVAEGKYEDEGWRVRKGGARFWANVVITAIRDEAGRLRGFSKVTRDSTERKRAEEQLHNSIRQLHALSAHLQSVREEERAHIAREIHDELGQALTAMKMDLLWLTRRLPAGAGGAAAAPLAEKISSMFELIDATIQTVRRIATELRPGVLDVLGLGAAIEWQAAEFQSHTGIVCDLDLAPKHAAVDQSRSTALFRILQEVLTNVARHADASRVSIKFEEKAGELVLVVSDDGKGITASEVSDIRSVGLLGMRERARLVGGEVTISGRDGAGTVVAVRVPQRDPPGEIAAAARPSL